MTTHPVPANKSIEQKSEGLLDPNIVYPASADYDTVSAASIDSITSLREFRRLIVVIPGQVTDQVQFSRAVRNLALPGQKTVVLVMLVNQADDELSGQRQLATLSSLVNDPRIKVQTAIAWDRSWEKSLRKMVLLGDLIVCPAETTVRKGLRQQETLSQALSRALAFPVYILHGFFPEKAATGRFSWRKLPFWVLIVAIFVGFFEFEAVSDLVDKGWPGQVLTVILVLIEFAFIYALASFAG
jgi:hypothetical protein